VKQDALVLGANRFGRDNSGGTNSPFLVSARVESILHITGMMRYVRWTVVLRLGCCGAQERWLHV
jgi:hypothetical protein